MPYWRWEQISENFPRQYKSGQSYQESLEILQENFPTSPFEQDLILEGIQPVVPGYTITAQDEAERESRRAISEIARNNLFAHFHNILALEDYPKGQFLERGLDLIFDVSGTAGAKEHNDQAHFLFAKQQIDLPGGKTTYSYPNSTIEQRTEFIKARLDQLFQTDFSKMYTMTDRDVAENFTKLYPVYLMMAEGGDNLAKLNGKLFNLPQSYLDKMVELKWQHQGIFGLMKNRFDCIMNPNYEIFHYERMKPAEERDFADVGPGGAEDLEARVRGSADAVAFFSTLGKFQQFSKTAYVDKINHEIEKLNLPKEMLLPPEVDDNGDRIASPLLEIFLPGNGVKLSTEDLKKGFDMVCFTNPATGQTHFLKYDGFNYKSVDMSRLPEPLRSGADKLMKALEEADPWYIRIFTGSKQFDEMKKAMKAVQELKDQMGLNPTEAQRKELADRLSTLTEKAGYYLQSKADGIQMDSSDAERARITAAERLLDYSLEGRALLAGYEQALAFKAKAHDAAFAANNEGMKEQAKEEESFARPREFTKPGHLYAQEQAEKQDRSLGGFWTVQDSPEMKAQVHAQREVRDFYNKGFAENDPLRALAENIYRSKGKGISTEEGRAQRIAEMVTLDIILRERQAYEKGGVGQIETLYRSNPQVFVKTLANSVQLKKIAESIDAKDLNNMVNATARDGIQQLTDKVLKEQGLELPKPQQPQIQQVMENQPKVPEPPKGAVPNGMG